MYDADYEAYEAYLQDMNTELEKSGYFTKDSGKRAEHTDGVVRDTDKGKPRFDLIFPKGVPFDDQLMTRVANLYERGGNIYGMRNWEKSNTPETLEHHEAALMRHVVRFLTGVVDGEDHAAAVVWNINAVDLTRRNIAKKEAEAANCDCLAGADLDWSEGDVLEEDRESLSLDGKPYCWVYERRTDTWKYHDSQDKEPAPESARSLKKLCKEFGPLKCTKGIHTGRIVGGS
jgi:hypothetical protein